MQCRVKRYGPDLYVFFGRSMAKFDSYNESETYQDIGVSHNRYYLVSDEPIEGSFVLNKAVERYECIVYHSPTHVSMPISFCRDALKIIFGNIPQKIFYKDTGFDGVRVARAAYSEKDTRRSNRD